jgi:Fic family protein
MGSQSSAGDNSRHLAINHQIGAGIRRQTGTRIVNPDTQEIIYTPPEGEGRIHTLLANLEAFANKPQDDLDPLIKMAVIHYQFEAIHPFYDGNGRAGRILLILYLLLEKLLDQPILFLSRYLIEHKRDYYRRLRSVTEEGAWEPWLLYMLEAVDVTARKTSRKIEAIARLIDSMIQESRAQLPKRVFSKELIEQLFVRPYCKIKFLEQAGIAGRVTASSYLRELEKTGFVRSVKIGTERLFINYRLLELLTTPEPGA